MLVKIFEKILQELKERGSSSICPGARLEWEESEIMWSCNECMGIFVGETQVTSNGEKPCPCKFHAMFNNIPGLIKKVENFIEQEVLKIKIEVFEEIHEMLLVNKPHIPCPRQLISRKIYRTHAREVYEKAADIWPCGKCHDNFIERRDTDCLFSCPCTYYRHKNITINFLAEKVKNYIQKLKEKQK